MSAMNKEIAATPKTVGERLRLWREFSKRTLLDVNEMIGVSQVSLYKLENNIFPPSTLILTQLHLHTDLNICWLLMGIGPVTTKSTAGRK